MSPFAQPIYTWKAEYNTCTQLRTNFSQAVAVLHLSKELGYLYLGENVLSWQSSKSNTNTLAGKIKYLSKM